jgi:DMSO reductase anchor subunit
MRFSLGQIFLGVTLCAIIVGLYKQDHLSRDSVRSIMPAAGVLLGIAIIAAVLIVRRIGPKRS